MVVDSNVLRKKRSNLVGTKLLQLSNKLTNTSGGTETFWMVFNIHVVVSTYTSVSVTKKIRNISMDQKIISTCCEG